MAQMREDPLLFPNACLVGYPDLEGPRDALRLVCVCTSENHLHMAADPIDLSA